MTDRAASAALAPDPQLVRRGRRGSTVAMLVLPLLAVTGILSVAWTVGVGDRCGGPLPGCGSLRNAGDNPVTVREVTDQTVTHVIVPAGQRVLLGGSSNELHVEAGQCLLVEGGPFWDARTVIVQSAETTGMSHPIDDWGARVQLHHDACPEWS